MHNVIFALRHSMTSEFSKKYFNYIINSITRRIIYSEDDFWKVKPKYWF